MNKIKIGYDLDDVIFDTLPSFLDFFNKNLGKKLKVENITSYYLWEVGIGKDKEEAIKFFDEFYNFSEFDKIPLVSGAKEGVLELAQLSDSKLYVVTSRPLRYRTKTLNSITENFPEIPLCIYYSNDFHEGEGAIFSKSIICQQSRLDCFVEDCFAYAEDIARRGTKVLLLRKPWNERDWNRLKDAKNGDNGNPRSNPKEKIIPVENWQEILDTENALFVPPLF